MIGTQLGPYILVEEIAKGGMATIFRAYHPNVDRFVALKVLHRSIVGDPRSVERFQREARLVTRLEHPHLLPIYDYSASHDPPYIVMRYLEGCTLSLVFTKDRLPVSEVIFMMRQVASAMDYAHRQGVVHRDIKPSNILIDQDGNAFVTDFGIARMMGMADGLTITHPGFTIGTPGYMAPEQSTEHINVDHRADLYSLGVLLFRLLTGRLPYQGDTLAELVSQHASAPIPKVTDVDPAIPKELDAIVARAMAKDPEKRYQSASDLSDDLSTVPTPETVVTPRVLRSIARTEIQRIRREREKRHKEIDAILKKYARSDGQAAQPGDNGEPSITSVIDLATLEKVLDAERTRPMRRRRAAIAIGVVALVITLLFSLQNSALFNPGGFAGTQSSGLSVVDMPALDAQMTATARQSRPTPAVQVLRDVTIRSGPGSQYAEVAVLEASEQVDILGISSDGAWFLVVLDDNQRGWVTSSSALITTYGALTLVPVVAAPTDTPTKTLTPTPTATRTPTATHTATSTPATPVVQALRDMSVRGGPGSQYSEVATLSAGMEIDIVGVSEDGAWFIVILENGQQGWITTSSSLVSAAGALTVVPVAAAPSETPTRTPSPTPSATPTLTPSLTPTPTASDTPTITLTATVTEPPTATLTATPATPVVILVRDIVVRAGPGSQYAQVALLQTDDQADIVGISSDGAWFLILLEDGQQGWVTSSTSLVQAYGALTVVPVATIPTEPPTSTPSPVPSETSTPSLTPSDTLTPTPVTPVVELLRDLAVRGGPGSQYFEVATLTAGSMIDIIGVSEDGAWFQVVLADGQQGWVTSSSSLVSAYGALAMVPVAAAPTNTPTKTPTLTPTASPTLTPTGTIPPSPTPTATFIPSPTPIPPGRLPYAADFEELNVLSSWDFDTAAWQVVNEGRSNVLLGTGDLQFPVRIAGLAQPEWAESNATNLVINFSINLDENGDAGRIVFRYSEDGYNVLEVLPGLLLLKRNAPDPNVFNRATERVIGSANVPIARGEWNDISIWLEGDRIFVYLNKRLTMIYADEIEPDLSAGEILLQALSPVRYDNIFVQRAEPASTHFSAEEIPVAWKRTTSMTATSLEMEPGGNRYFSVDNNVLVQPLMQPIRDITMSCRLWVEEGGFTIRLRDNPGGTFVFEGVAGHLNVRQLGGLGQQIRSFQVPNFYNRQRWDEINLTFIGDQLQIYRDGRLFFEDTLENSPAAGVIEFETGPNDRLRIDDCLIAETSTSPNTGARFAYAVIREVNERPFLLLSSDLDENFADPFRTDDWWQDGQDAPGQFINDPDADEHQNFLRITHRGRPTWRLIRNVVGLGIFGAGQNQLNYADSTDVYVTVDVRFPSNNTGSAWLGIRTTPTITGAELTGYRLELRRNLDGTTDAIVRLRNTTEDVIYYENRLLENDVNGPVGAWTTLTALSQNDKVAFFVNDQFLVALDNVAVLGGTVALGVDGGTTADFDDLIIRDTTPSGR